MEYETVVGLEVHAELNTKTKIYCNCRNAFGLEVNTQICPICTGMPGTLPTLNEKVVEYAVKMGHATNCSINNVCKQDRKNYFYPDLPKAYQISQADIPLCEHGYVDIMLNGEEKRIGINRIHIEEDAGKMLHDEAFKGSLVDFNRCGVPLIEIVSEPDMRSSEEAKAYLDTLKSILQYLDISDCKMEQGSIRCDVNVSVRPKGSAEFGKRVEMKNVNSFSGAMRAIDYEANRQIEALERGEEIFQETRRWDDQKGQNFLLRSKEDAQDYRYFPDPDIPPIIFTEEELEEIRRSIPELPEQRVERYVTEYGINKKDADIIVGDKRICDFFDEAISEYDNPKAIANYIIGELMRRINLGEADPDNLKFGGREFAQLVEMMQTDKVSQANAKTILREMVENGGTPKAIADAGDLWIKEDSDLLAKTVDEIIANNPKAAEQYRSGDQKVFGFFMGQANKALKGAASPKAIQEYIRKKLS